MGYFQPCPPGTSYYHSNKSGFYTPLEKDKIITTVEGELTFMWQHDSQPKGQYHIFSNVEIGLNHPLEDYEDHYGESDRKHARSIITPWIAYSKDIVCLNLEKNWQLAVLENLTDAFEQGRLHIGTKLKFEIFDDENIPSCKTKTGRAKQKQRSMRIFIDDSKTPEPTIYTPTVEYYTESRLQKMIDTIYHEAKYLKYKL